MSNENLLQLEYQRRRQKQQETDPIKIFSMMFTRWYYFLILLIVALTCAHFYISYTIPTYKVSATLLIDQEKKGSSIGNDQLLEGFGLGAGMKNLDNQIMVLSSRTLVGKTLNELNLDIEYFHRGLFNNIDLYPNAPIKIVAETTDSLPRNVEFIYKYIDNNKFSLDTKSDDIIDLHIQASFGEIIKTRLGRFSIELSSDAKQFKNTGDEIHFIIHSRKNLIESYSRQIKVDPASKMGTIVRISLIGTNKAKCIDFLNKLTEIFLNNSLDKKNQEASRTIQFIDDQLIGISDSLVITENKLQQFRSKNKIMNLSAQGQVIIDQAMKLENEKARIEIEANYYDYLAEYLVKDNVGEVPIAPATMGITDPGLTRLVAELAEFQGQFFSKSLGEKNPLQSQVAQRVRNTKEALKETLNGVRRANNLARNENLSQIRTINAQATALPVTERQLLGIERKFKLNDELYTFLLEKRSVAQIQKASNVTDNEVVDPSDSDAVPVSPKSRLIYVIAIFSGIGLPFIWIWAFDTFNDKVKDEDDLKNITDIPVIGYIPHSILKKNTVVFNEPNSYVAEAFRSMRSRMQFFTKETKNPVIIISSSMPNEGKTFTAINLASVYSLMGKKTILVGFDLRKPKIYNDFGLANDCGVSTWLIGKDRLDDLIQKTGYDNLFLLPAGPIPPNPSELTALDKTGELIRLLRERFDCIIIDSSPIGTVSDTFHIASLADTFILIVRKNLTLKYILENTVRELKMSDIKSISIVINDLTNADKRYRYGGKYRYSYGKGKKS